MTRFPFESSPGSNAPLFPYEVWMDGRLRYRAASRSRARRLALGYWRLHPESSRYEIADTVQHPEGITIEKCRRRDRVAA